MKWAALPALLLAGPLAAATLEGFASLDAHTLAPGPGSGRFISDPPESEPPFDGQPVQGFSAIVSNDDGTYLVLSDNGYGSRANSADFLLRIYCIEPDFRTANGGTGVIQVDGFITLEDGGPVTGADFDPESLQRAADGSFWVGEEFGPFLLHLDSRGELLENPFQLAGLVSDSRPGSTTEPTLPRSRGFEGMAMSPAGDRLYPMLEGALFDQEGQLNIYTFDLETRSFINANALEPSYRYRPEPEATAIGSFRLFSETSGLVLERDSGQAGKARHKKVYRVDFSQVDDEGFLVKHEVADLLAIDDPHDLDGDGSTKFSFPFQTPEALLVLDRNTIGIVNDNNYPFGRGRGEDRGPESTEFILLTIDRLW